MLPHSTYFIRQFLVFVLFIVYCFGEIMCIWDSYVYQKGVFCFLLLLILLLLLLLLIIIIIIAIIIYDSSILRCYAVSI